MLLGFRGASRRFEIAVSKGFEVYVLVLFVDSELARPLHVGKLARSGGLSDRLDVSQVRLFYLVELGECPSSVSGSSEATLPGRGLLFGR